MADPARLERLVRRVARQVRRRRMEFYGLKGAFYGSLAAVVPLLVKGVAGPEASAVAGGLVLLGAAAGAVFGFTLKAPGPDVARVADRAFGLEDRVATAVEWARRPDRTPLVDRLIEDALGRIERLQTSAAVRRVLPGEARLLPLPLLVVLALALAPAVPLPGGRTSDVAAHSDVEGAPEGVGKIESSDQVLAKPDPAKPGPLSERDPEQASPTMVNASDRPALFKDTALGAQRPDFNSFLKKGDERLKLLEQVDALPDLQSDFTQSQYKSLLDLSKALTQGLRPEQVPAQKLRELLQQMEQLGSKQAQEEAAQDAARGLKALERGQQEKAIDALSRSLNTLRHAEEERKGALNLSGGKQGETGRRSRESGESKELGDAEQEDPGASQGLEPGKGPGEHPKADATARLGAKPYDTEVQGDPRSGKKDSVETNTFGRAARVPSRLPTGSAFDQYRRMMEEAIAREDVPRDYQPQVKDYFRALSEK